MDTPKSKVSARKLTTIFAADVADYSRHVSEDEDSALRQLRELREIMDSIIADHGGRIANTAGDSVIAEFGSPIECVRAAVQIQQQHKLHNEQIPKEQRLLYRIGINIGDVSQQDDGDLLGNGVNVAARLESIAMPGGICLSENVHNLVSGSIDLSLSKIGEHFVKNIDKPILVYAVGDERNPRLQRAARSVVKLARRPATIVAILLLAGVASLTGIWSFFTAPDYEEDVVSFDKMSKQEILDHFDLVTQGSFGGSEYFVIRVWHSKFEDTYAIARALGGHLVAINSEEENEFVYQLSLRDVGHWRNGEPQNSFYGPLIGLVQAAGAPEPDGGWGWFNGDPLEYINWKTWGPENAEGNQSHAIMWGRGEPSSKWNDISTVQWSIVVEVETQ